MLASAEIRCHCTACSVEGLGYRIITLNGDARYWIFFFFPISNTPKSSNSFWLIADANTDIFMYFQRTSRLSCTEINIFVLHSHKTQEGKVLCVSLNAGSFVYLHFLMFVTPRTYVSRLFTPSEGPVLPVLQNSRLFRSLH